MTKNIKRVPYQVYCTIYVPGIWCRVSDTGWRIKNTDCHRWLMATILSALCVLVCTRDLVVLLVAPWAQNVVLTLSTEKHTWSNSSFSIAETGLLYVHTTYVKVYRNLPVRPVSSHKHARFLLTSGYLFDTSLGRYLDGTTGEARRLKRIV